MNINTKIELFTECGNIETTDDDKSLSTIIKKLFKDKNPEKNALLFLC